MKAVVPLAGTWIETLKLDRISPGPYVVPLAGTWIETCKQMGFDFEEMQSFPLRERGLKRAV